MAYTHRDLPDNLREGFKEFLSLMEATSIGYHTVNGVPRLEFHDDCFNESLPLEERTKMIHNQSIDYYLGRLELITDHDFYLKVDEFVKKMDGYTAPKMKTVDDSGKVTQEVRDHVERKKVEFRQREAIIDESFKKWKIEDPEDDHRNAIHECMMKFAVIMAPDK